ncbi:MAG: substrate-binding domain-containing protein [Intestinibacter sp.]
MKNIKKIMGLALTLVLGLTVVGCSSSNSSSSSSSSEAKDSEVKEITMASTYSLDETGFLADTLKTFEEENGVKVNVVARGTGEAIELGKTGDADILFVHAKSKEEEFIKEGYGVDRTEIMYNYFVVLGPKDGEHNEEISKLNVVDAFKYIADNDLVFLSRGDQSGTHVKELSIWKEAGIETPDFSNYNESGKGQAETVKMASEMGGYVITDKATYLSNKDNLDLEIVIGEDDTLKNVYSVLRIKDIDDETKAITDKLVEFYASDDMKETIREYGKDKYGEALYFVIGE